MLSILKVTTTKKCGVRYHVEANISFVRHTMRVNAALVVTHHGGQKGEKFKSVYTRVKGVRFGGKGIPSVDKWFSILKTLGMNEPQS